MEELANLGRYDILVVEDDKDLRRIISFNLKASGFSVRQAENGKVALEKVHEKKPDCIILDVMMPVMDGLEVCKRLKSLDSTRDIPVIFLSARGATEDKIRGMKFDADDYMVKPFDFKELLARIYLHISKQNVKKHDVESEKDRSVRDTIVQMSEELSEPVKDLRDGLIELMDKVNGYPELEHIVRSCEEHRRMINDIMLKYNRMVDPFFSVDDEDGADIEDETFEMLEVNKNAFAEDGTAAVEDVSGNKLDAARDGVREFSADTEKDEPALNEVQEASTKEEG